MTQALEIIIKILSIIGIILTVLQAYKILYLIGLFKHRKYKKTDNYHTYGICIAARNEEKVIHNLLDSLENLDYDKSKLKIFVVADNCNDSTADIVRDFASTSKIETRVYEHNDPNERMKGYALRYLFDQIKEEYGSRDIVDGYFIFDADNVLKQDYILRMNEAFDEGKEVIVSYRNSKNVSRNWISFSYAIHWLRTCLFENRGKTIIGLSCRIQGTGFLFSNKYVKDGWKYLTLTEDRYFCTDVVVGGGKVAYCEEAVFFDEQPYKAKVALRQRLRWAKGNLQSSVEFCPRLALNFFRFNKTSIPSYDTFWLNFPRHIEALVRHLLSWTCKILLAVLLSDVLGVTWGIVSGILISYGKDWILRFIQAIIVYCYYKKDIGKIKFWKLLGDLFLFPIFDIIGKWSMILAIFMHVEWKPIPHDCVVDVKTLK